MTPHLVQQQVELNWVVGVQVGLDE